MRRISKRWTAALYIFVVLFLSAGAIVGAILVTHTQTAQVENGKRRCEDATPHNLSVKIQNDTVTPKVTDAKKCDTLTITNLDPTVRLLAFGRHEDHISYDGVSERQLSQGKSLTITLVKTGTYLFHDHLNDEVQGTFVVR